MDTECEQIAVPRRYSQWDIQLDMPVFKRSRSPAIFMNVTELHGFTNITEQTAMIRSMCVPIPD
jgi:hypothetical protein